ncbi:hypothetical protein EG329_012609 [Mollisiaceae sp. DMI_Dod_QoI]|nr:hypothetical protein EG329_012609 [Helotiales sp. DMI_Dod_QoI]
MKALLDGKRDELQLIKVAAFKRHASGWEKERPILLQTTSLLPASVTLDATAFCSEFLRPLVTQLSIINISGGTTTSTATVESLIYFSPTSTSTSTSTSVSSASHSKSTTPAFPDVTALPKLEVAEAIKKRDFTVPDYLTDWYFYGRIDPGCSCIITSAAESILISATLTSTHYRVTVSTTVTETYTIYP